MTFTCSEPNDLTTALRQSSGIEFYISQLPDGNIGKCVMMPPALSVMLFLI